MRFLSVFSGIEAASVAWQSLGWKAAAFAEIDPFACAVLAHHYPDVPNLGSVTDITEEQVAALGQVDLIVGGFPCQDLSVAGRRAGLRNDDGTVTRSGLFFDAMRIVRWAREHCGLRWLLIENVPGLYSSNRGRDFAAVVGEMVGAEFDVPRDGWRNAGFAAGPDGLCEWATLDAQFFGVAQRRRRVFALADFGDWASRPPILLEPESLRGDSAPSREAGQGTPAGALRSTDGGSDVDHARAHQLIPAPHDVISPALKARDSKGPSSDGDGDGAILVPMVAPTLQAGGNDTGGHRPPGTTVDTADSLVVTHPVVPAHTFDARQSDVIQYGDKTGPIDTDGHTMAVAFSCKDHGADAGEIAPTLRSMGHDASHANGGGQVAVAFNISGSSRQDFNVRPTDVAACLSTRSQEPSETTHNSITAVVASVMQVRRLTPRECERLQGFPDDYTLIPVRGKPAPDGPRYKALGNSMAVPVMRWIGQRIAAVHALALDTGKVAA